MVWLLQLKNDVGRALTPYPVDAGPPPRRIADPAHELALGATQSVDTGGFNPLFAIASLPQNPGVPNGFVVQMSFDGANGEILVRTAQHRVTPDQDASAPGLTPIPIADFPFPGLTEGSYELVAGAEMKSFQLQPIKSSGGGCLLWPFLLIGGGLAERLL